MDKRVNKERAYVLHTRPYRDTSLIVDVLTESYGRIAVVAKSARGPKSRFRGQVTPMTPLLVSWTGLSELKTLTAIDAVGLPAQLQGDALWACFYAHELMLRLLAHDDEHPRLFESYEALLVGLREPGSYSALRYFELALLAELGYAPTLHQTAHGESVLPDCAYRYVLDHGLVAMGQAEQDGLIFLGSDLLALHRQELEGDSELSTAKRLLRYILSHRIGPKPLKTKQLWGQLQGSKA